MTPQEEKAVAHIATQTDPAQLRIQLQNATRAGSQVVAQAALRRLVELGAVAEEGTVQRRFWDMVLGLEELRRQAGKRYWRANHIRKSADGGREIEALTSCVRRTSSGFLEVIEFGAPELAAEVIVHEFPQHFSQDIRDQARERLADAGFDTTGKPLPPRAA